MIRAALCVVQMEIKKLSLTLDFSNKLFWHATIKVELKIAVLCCSHWEVQTFLKVLPQSLQPHSPQI